MASSPTSEKEVYDWTEEVTDYFLSQAIKEKNQTTILLSRRNKQRKAKTIIVNLKYLTRITAYVSMETTANGKSILSNFYKFDFY